MTQSLCSFNFEPHGSRRPMLMFFFCYSLALQKITSNLGAHTSRQSFSIKGETRSLGDGVSLKECYNAGGEVRQHAGWSELHLELIVKDFLFSQNGFFTVSTVSCATRAFVFCFFLALGMIFIVPAPGVMIDSYRRQQQFISASS